MKKTILSLMLTLSIFTAAIKPAQAFVVPGGYAVGYAMARIGIFAVAGIVIGQAIVEPDKKPGVPWWMLLPILAGFVILDGEQELTYKELSQEQSNKLNMTELERLSFNAEIDQVNATVSFVANELAEMEDPRSEDSIRIWKDVKDLLSPEAFSALIKVTGQLYK